MVEVAPGRFEGGETSVTGGRLWGAHFKARLTGLFLGLKNTLLPLTKIFTRMVVYGRGGRREGVGVDGEGANVQGTVPSP